MKSAPRGRAHRQQHVAARVRGGGLDARRRHRLRERATVARTLPRPAHAAGISIATPTSPTPRRLRFHELRRAKIPSSNKIFWLERRGCGASVAG